MIDQDHWLRQSIEILHRKEIASTSIEIMTFNSDCIPSIWAITIHNCDDAFISMSGWLTICCHKGSVSLTRLNNLSDWLSDLKAKLLCVTQQHVEQNDCSISTIKQWHCDDYRTCLYDYKDCCKCSRCLEHHNSHEHVSKNLKFEILTDSQHMKSINIKLINWKR